MVASTTETAAQIGRSEDSVTDSNLNNLIAVAQQVIEANGGIPRGDDTNPLIKKVAGALGENIWILLASQE